MSKIERIELSQLPQELREVVEKELRGTSAKLLGCTKSEKGKTILYHAYTEYGAILTVWGAHYGNSVLEGKVSENYMSVDDIQFFIDNSIWFKGK